VDKKTKKGKNIMKKLLILGMSSVFAFGATAQTLEERVEALEYAGYENFTKVSGRLEYRFDSYTREIKDAYGVVNTGTNAAEARSVGKQGAGYQRVFLNLDVSSMPSDKLSFYGKLSMAKYVNHFNTDDNTKTPEDASFNDLSRGSAASSSSIFVERAFANYAFSKNLTLTFGRLPTSHGAPRQFSSNEAKKGNYPVLSFGGNWDGMALSYGLEGGHAFKLVYTPVSSVPFSGSMLDGLSDSASEKVDVNSPAYALIYEFDRANFAGSRNFYFTATYFTLKDMPTLPSAGSNLYLSLDRTSFYTEFSGIKGSKFDAYLHGVSTVTKSEGGLTGVGGWLTSSTDSDSKSGTAMGLGVKYNLKPNMKLGLEYFSGSEDAFLYDSANQDAASIYTTYGDAQHLFYSHSFDGGLDIVVGHIVRNSKYTRAAFNLIGSTSEIDNIETNSYAKFITKF
jgi:opacity protein-like surface antigen